MNDALTLSNSGLEDEKARLREENKALQSEVARLSSQLNDLRSRPPREPENEGVLMCASVYSYTCARVCMWELCYDHDLSIVRGLP